MTVTRPEFPRKEIPFGTSKQVAAEWEAEFNEEVDRLEARGPLRFEFPTDREYGYLAAGSIVGETQMYAMRGVLEFGTYDTFFYSEAFGLPAEVLRDNPFEHVGDFAVKGAGDAQLQALCSRPGLTGIDMAGRAVVEEIAEADTAMLSKEERQQVAELVERQQGWAEQARSVEGLLTDDGIAAIPDTVTSLRLFDTEITDDAVSALLSRLSGLEILTLQSSRLEGRYLSALAGREQLLEFQCHSEALSGAVVMANVPSLPLVEAITLVGARAAEGLDPAELRRRFPALGEFTCNPGTLPEADLYRLALGLPGVAINGVELSERAVRKAAKKRGIEL